YSIAATRAIVICALSLHDALPIYEICLFAGLKRSQFILTPADPGAVSSGCNDDLHWRHSCLKHKRHLTNRHPDMGIIARGRVVSDRKSTRLNSSHVTISYAVFCLK